MCKIASSFVMVDEKPRIILWDLTDTNENLLLSREPSVTHFDDVFEALEEFMKKKEEGKNVALEINFGENHPVFIGEKNLSFILFASGNVGAKGIINDDMENVEFRVRED